ncbi:MAG: prepilin-type N-terminal cleavage/methylation domain-containing protein [bacterium]|jgi:prepilin-type N-terminal cleavage/methylation domain-containing protein|nr:prepilin-type N-terminal cleavage/methylation domain-containing protein [bacterium]
MMKPSKAFTLIELLIVVAIIAILAAIAIPNFMNARVRANVARSQADINTIVNALMTYQVDHNAIPPRLIQQGSSGQAIAPTYLPHCFYLTTPIPYFTASQAVSPFNRRGDQIPHGYWYYNWEDVKTQNLALTISFNKRENTGLYRWMTSTIGPCTEIYPYQTFGLEGGGTNLMFMDYDPSNGLYSPGLIQTHGK